MDIVRGFLFAVVVLISLILICLILVQPSKSGGLGSAFGGVGESVFGAHAMGHLSKLTVVLITVFFVLTLALAVISGHSQGGKEEDMKDKISSMAQQISESAEQVVEESKDAIPEQK